MVTDVLALASEVLDLIAHHQYEKAELRLKASKDQLHKQHTATRREKVDELNRTILELNIAIKRVESSVKHLGADCPLYLSKTVNEWIRELKAELTSVELLKRRISRGGLRS